MFWFSYASPIILVAAVWAAYRIGKRSRDRLDQQQGPGHLGQAKEVVQDLKQVRQHTDQLNSSEQSRTDPLTGLSSRQGMEDILKMLLAMKSRYDTRFAIALVDIDGFQKINDQFGHVRGDEMLRSFAATLDSTVRETDVVVRFGGEEFVVIMPETDLPGASGFGLRLRKNTREKLSIAISVGVAEARAGDTLSSLLSRTDSALYSAKSGGGDCVFQHTGRRIELARPLKTVALPSTEASESDNVPTIAANP